MFGYTVAGRDSVKDLRSEIRRVQPSSIIGRMALPGSFAVGGDDECGEALERATGLADQVAQIRAGRDQQSGTGRGLLCSVQSSPQNGSVGGLKMQ